MSMGKKRVYDFTQGSKEQKDLLGGKGANLAEMTSIGLPVPRGFTITTEACLEYLNSKKLDAELIKEIESHIALLEKETGKKFADNENPLLVSVRSGSKFSMPGMMDTILNLGLNHQSVEILAQKTGNPVFAYDCYRRLIQMFGDVVKAVDKNLFEEALTDYKMKHAYTSDTEMQAVDWKQIIKQFSEIYLKEVGEKFPQEPACPPFSASERPRWLNPSGRWAFGCGQAPRGYADICHRMLGCNRPQFAAAPGWLKRWCGGSGLTSKCRLGGFPSGLGLCPPW